MTAEGRGLPEVIERVGWDAVVNGQLDADELIAGLAVHGYEIVPVVEAAAVTIDPTTGQASCGRCGATFGHHVRVGSVVRYSDGSTEVAYQDADGYFEFHEHDPTAPDSSLSQKTSDSQE